MWTEVVELARTHEVLAGIVIGAVMFVGVALVAAVMDWFVGLAEREDSRRRV